MWFADLDTAKNSAGDVISLVEATPVVLTDGAKGAVSVSGGFTLWLEDPESAGGGMDGS